MKTLVNQFISAGDDSLVLKIFGLNDRNSNGRIELSEFYLLGNQINGTNFSIEEAKEILEQRENSN